MTLDDLRRFAVARSLFEPVTLKRAVEKLGFVQADPIRAPARAQDLILRHRVKGYRAGDLERRYASLGIEEDVFVNYGFVSSAVHALMHPRAKRRPPATSPRTRAERVLTYVRERGEVHPREVDGYFAHGTVTNYWGGSSSATTRLLEEMHYTGLLRIARRERGIRIYAVRENAAVTDAPPPRDRVDALVDVAVRQYAPLPALSLSNLIGRLRYAAPQWRRELKAALDRARRRLAHSQVDGIDWVLARRRASVHGGATAHGATARPLRSGGVGPPQIRAALGMGLSVRGLHTCFEAQARLLRAPAVVA